jgi:hypothetical protein
VSLADHEAAARTDCEARFLGALASADPPPLDVWPQADEDGTPWLCLSLSFIEAEVVRATLRLDFDCNTMKGGWSPANLNCYDGVRADDAGVDTGSPDGLLRPVLTPEDAAGEASEWFRGHLARWRA